MIAAERTALLLLAAGRSQRFGDADKLVQPVGDRPLALHAVAAAAPVPFAARGVVVSGTTLDLSDQGYAALTNPHPEHGLARSLAFGIVWAQHCDIDAVLVMLADMPCVRSAHLRRLLAAADGPEMIVASTDGVRRSPPALFGRAHFPALMTQQGDQGARALLLKADTVSAPASELIDIDTPKDLSALAARLLPLPRGW